MSYNTSMILTVDYPEDITQWLEGHELKLPVFIYVLMFEDEVPFYVGSTNSPERRLREHANGEVRTTDEYFKVHPITTLTLRIVDLTTEFSRLNVEHYWIGNVDCINGDHRLRRYINRHRNPQKRRIPSLCFDGIPDDLYSCNDRSPVVAVTGAVTTI